MLIKTRCSTLNRNTKLHQVIMKTPQQTFHQDHKWGGINQLATQLATITMVFTCPTLLKLALEKLATCKIIFLISEDLKTHMTFMSLLVTDQNLDIEDKWKVLEWVELSELLHQDTRESEMLLEWLENWAKKTSLFPATNSWKWSEAHVLNTFQEIHQFLQFWAIKKGIHYNIDRISKEAFKQFTDKRGGWMLTLSTYLIMDQELIMLFHNQDTERNHITKMQVSIKE